MMRDGYQPKPPKDGKKPKPPWGGSDVGGSPELKCKPNSAPQIIYIQESFRMIEDSMHGCWTDKEFYADNWKQEYIRADLYDDPLTDSTDFAHPAWWRAEEYSYHMMCERINEFLDSLLEPDN